MSKNKVVASVAKTVPVAAARPRHHGIVVISRPCVVASRQRAERERCLHSSSHILTQHTLLQSLQHVLFGSKPLVPPVVAGDELRVQEDGVKDSIAKRVNLRLILISKLAKIESANYLRYIASKCSQHRSHDVAAHIPHLTVYPADFAHVRSQQPNQQLIIR
jgi:hypothetical protein